MKRTIRILMACVVMVSAAMSQSSDAPKRIGVGLQGGLIRAANESGYEGIQQYCGSIGIFSLFRNGLAPGLSPELNIAFTQNQSTDPKLLRYADYETSIITADVRLRWYPMQQDALLSPYFSVGAGLLMPTNKAEFVKSPPSDYKKDAASLQFPVTGGITHNITDNLAIDGNIGWVLSLTDDINPEHDGVNDGWFMIKAGILYSFGAIESDSDSDELTDKVERGLGTDPMNPDTDGDGLKDGEEVNIYKTDPLNKDTDDGGIDDGTEVRLGTDPLDVSDDIASIAVGETIQIRNIEFAVSKSEITGQSERILRRVLKLLNDKQDLTLEIAGHTDNTGAHDFNMQLSNDRAKAVKDWLVAKGVAETRLTTMGYGPDKPTATNDTTEGRRRNRRVEFKRTK